MRRSRFVAMCTTLAVLAGGGAAYVVTRPAAAPIPSSRAAPVPTRPDVLPVLAGTATPSVPGLRATLRNALRDPAFGGSIAGVVVDAATGATLFGRAARAAVRPASTLKLLTAVSALHVLGPGARLTTRVVRAGSTLFLVGGGDVTLAARRRPAPASYPPPATMPDLAQRVAAALAGTTRVRLRYDSSAWTGPASAPGWNAGYFTAGDVSRLSALEVDEGRLRPDQHARVPDPAAQAAAVFARALRRSGVTVVGPARPATAPPTAGVVAAVDSAPVAALVQQMLTVSDNDLAEALGRALAVRLGQPASFAGEAAALTTALRRLGVPLAGVRLVDASGLSRADRVTAATLAAVLRLVIRDEATFGPVSAGLPVAGFTGTLADRYRRPPARAAAGLVRAKTGTLAGVSTLAGQVVDADGRLLVFAFLSNHAPAPTAAEAALDRLAARLAQCGCA
ncbi:MAG TPA: D-alanyl-D-alanine carboxypeptidase/D-alanyl-D-alanine-endopeptidase [Mycobacteriales bacterium]|nr:D-alanyl-D-alanine carboxypeptidase/D-alanyl-D-alanine-endopeptidase [Mycobacteriales bacterium]